MPSRPCQETSPQTHFLPHHQSLLQVWRISGVRCRRDSITIEIKNQDSSLSPMAARSREWDGPSRWADYPGTDMNSPLSSSSFRNFIHDGQSQGTTPSQSHKGLNMQWVVQLTQVGEDLMAKMYRLNQLLDYPSIICFRMDFGKPVYSSTILESVFCSLRSFQSTSASCSLNV